MIIRIDNIHIGVERDWFRVGDNLLFRHLFTKYPIIAAEIEINGGKEIVVVDNKKETIVLARPATPVERDCFYNFDR